MIKCGKLEGTEQCILYSKDGSKVLNRFPYAKHGGKEGAKKAAGKREGQVQFFKKKSLEAAVEQFGAAPVLAYIAKSEAERGNPALQNELTAYVEKARDFPTGGPGKAPVGYNLPKNWTPASAKKYWESIGGSVTACMKKLGGEKAARFCASLKDYATGTTKWRGPEKKKSFEEDVEEALEMLKKDEQTEEPKTEEEPTLSDVLRDVDLADLEQFLVNWGQKPAAETVPVEEPPAEVIPAEEPSAAEPELEFEEEVPEEWDHNFLNFLRVDHQRRQAAIQEAIFGPAEEE